MEGKKGGGRGNRGARVAASASQYSFNLRYSNRAKRHGAPASCVAKLAYDFRLFASGKNRVAFTYFSVSPEHQFIVKDLLLFARMCESTAGRQESSRQMAHPMCALPAELSDSARNRLVIAICDRVRNLREGQPVFGAVHQPAEGEKNAHLHMSHGLRTIRLTSPTSYALGERILFEQRPKTRIAAGLPATNHTEMRMLREQIAELIATSLSEENLDPQLVERWRCGHLPLETQVRMAKERGDEQFYRDHAYRDPTQHEGYRGRKWNRDFDLVRQGFLGSSSYQTDLQKVGPKALTHEIVTHILALAKRKGIKRFSHLRMFALDHDIIIRPKFRKLKDGRYGALVDLGFRLVGGAEYSGRSLRNRLADVCAALEMPLAEVGQTESRVNETIDEFSSEFYPKPDELRARYEGRVTVISLLYLLAIRGDLISPLNSQRMADRSTAELPGLGLTERTEFETIAEDLRRPLDFSERESRNAQILEDLDTDDFLREYVARYLVRQLPAVARDLPVTDNLESDQLELVDNDQDDQDEQDDVHSQPARRRESPR